MEVGQRHLASRAANGFGAVSNLVVMEVGQRQLHDPCEECAAEEVSNLVVMEVGQRLPNGSNTEDRSPRFQTLLSWKSVSGPVTLSPTGDPLYGFKPCCHGSRSAAPGDPSTDNGCDEVSNLVVMEVGQRPGDPSTDNGCDEVSNLVVMEVGQRHSIRNRACDFSLSFKPCCHGSRSAAPALISPSTPRQPVSNLVVMEVGQRLDLVFLAIALPSGFQTLLSWKSVSGRREHRPG